MESKIFDKDNFKIKEVTIVFDENDDILESIKDFMLENMISKVEIISFNGKIKNFSINYFLRNSLKQLSVLEPREVRVASGEFKLDLVDKKLYGRARIRYDDVGKTFEGILTKGYAVQDLSLDLRFFEYK